MLKKNLAFGTFTIIAANLFADTLSVESTAGSLMSLIGDKSQTVEELTVTGTVDVRDLTALSIQFPAMKKLDLSEATVKAYTNSVPDWMNRCHFPAASIPAYAFHNTKIKEIILPASLEEIGEGAFAGSSINKISIGQKVKKIGDWAFISTGLTEITLPAVSVMGKGIFENCTELQRADLSEVSFSRLPDRTFAGAYSLTLVSLSDQVSAIGNEAFIASGLKEIDLSVIPDAGDYAFADSTIQSVTLSDANLSKGEFFHSKSLKSINGDIHSIADASLAGCYNLYNGTFVVNTVSLDDWALADIMAPQLFFGKNLTHVGNNALNGIEGLIDIDVMPLGDRIPDTSPDAFAGIDQSNIMLHVAKNCEDIWENHPQWGLFNITSQKTSVGSVDINILSNAFFTGNILNIASDIPLRRITVSDQEGNLIVSDKPDTETISVDTSISGSKVFIINAVTDRGASEFKILRLQNN